MVLFQTVYDTWFITCYNLIYTSLPVLGLSLFEKVRPGSRLLDRAETLDSQMRRETRVSSPRSNVKRIISRAGKGADPLDRHRVRKESSKI